LDEDDGSKKVVLINVPQVAPIQHAQDVNLVLIGVCLKADRQQLQSALGVCQYFPAGKCKLFVVAPHRTFVAEEILGWGLGDSFSYMADPSNLTGSRTAKLAQLRNAAVKGALQKYPQTQNIMFADLDGVVSWSNMTIGAILNVVQPKNLDKWDVVSFTSTAYYDWWALRCDQSDPNCWDEHSIAGDSRCSGKCLESCRIGVLKQCIKKAHSLGINGFRAVDSAFNGLSLIKVAAMGKCQYDPDTVNSPDGDCEHVSFNRCMKASGRQVVVNGATIETRSDYGREWLSLIPNMFRKL